MTPSIRAAAVRVLLTVAAGRATLAAEVDRARAAWDDARDRSLLLELTAGTLRWRGEVDAVLTACASRPPAEIHETVLTVLRIGIYELRHLSRMPAHAVVNEAVEAARALGQKRATGFVNAVLREAQRRGAAIALPPRPTSADDREGWLAYLSTTLSHPRWLVERYLDRAGADGAERWCRYNLDVPRPTVRPRGGTLTPALAAALTASGATPSPTIPGCWRLTAAALAGLSADTRDALAVQDEGSQWVAQHSGATPGDRVLDICAAPGGKTALLARAVTPAGWVVAADIRPARIRVLRETLNREALTRVPIVRLDAAVGVPFDRSFDRVLVDAPCSGLGTIGRDPDVKWTRTAASLPRYAALQTAILTQAATAVRPNGHLVYATCSSEPEENVAVIDAFLATTPAFARACADGATRPDRDGLDAFFAAVLVRREGA